MLVRRLLYKLDYRYRLHCDDLLGKPDIVFLGRKKVIFVQDYFWHGHSCKRGNRIPLTNKEYWIKKISRNKIRFSRQVDTLETKGFTILILWECELKNKEKLKATLVQFLENKKQSNV